MLKYYDWYNHLIQLISFHLIFGNMHWNKYLFHIGQFVLGKCTEFEMLKMLNLLPYTGQVKVIIGLLYTMNMNVLM